MKVKELLNSPEKWAIGMFARDEKGKAVSPTCNEATSWCLVGAMCVCYDYNNVLSDQAIDARDRIVDAYNKLYPDKIEKNGISLSILNDDKIKTFEELQALLQEADV